MSNFKFKLVDFKKALLAGFKKVESERGILKGGKSNLKKDLYLGLSPGSSGINAGSNPPPDIPENTTHDPKISNSGSNGNHVAKSRLDQPINSSLAKGVGCLTEHDTREKRMAVDNVEDAEISLKRPRLMEEGFGGLNFIKSEDLSYSQDQLAVCDSASGFCKTNPSNEPRISLDMALAVPYGHMSEVKMWPMACMDVVEELVLPTLMVPVATTCKLKRVSYDLVLPPTFYDICRSPVIEPSDMKYEVVFRFCKYPPTEETFQDESHPTGLFLTVNGMPIPQCMQGRSKPIRLSPYLFTERPTHVDITWSIEEISSSSSGGDWFSPPQSYLFSAYLCQKLSVSQILDRILVNSQITTDAEVGGVKFPRIFDTWDSELDIEAVKVSLICPITKTKIRVPGRGVKCTHISVIDLESFVNFCVEHNIQKLTCPHCNIPMMLEDLRVDFFFRNFLKTMDNDYSFVYVENR